MKRLLNLLRGRNPMADQAFEAPLAPDGPLAVIGDVHGRDDLLGRLLGRLAEEAPDHAVVLVGDLIDRGEQSAQVLRRLAARPDILCLRGNHDVMCLDFLDEPERAGPGWLHNGGLQTLASFGVGAGGLGRPEALREARDALALAMGDGLVDWLGSRPLWWQSGNVVVTHAGADPLRSMAEQEDRDLLWGSSRFGKMPRSDGLWVVHGHRIQPEAHATAGRIAVDTGAYATGRLTAALISPGELRFLST
jgi:serine/threonine protein phosphatase 1